MSFLSLLSCSSGRSSSLTENSMRENGKQPILPVIETTTEGAILGDAYKVTNQIGKETLYIPVIVAREPDWSSGFLGDKMNGIESYFKRVDFAKESIRVDRQCSGINCYMPIDVILKRVEQHSLQKGQSLRSCFFDFSYDPMDLKEAVDYLESFTFSWFIKEKLRLKATDFVSGIEEREIENKFVQIMNELEELQSLAQLPRAKESYLHQARDVELHVSEIFNRLEAFEKRGYSAMLKTAFKTLEVFHNRWT